MVDMIHVDSSNIDAIGYDPEVQDLYVRFQSGDTYVYHGVPQVIHDNLMATSSKGRFLNREVKDTYPFDRI